MKKNIYNSKRAREYKNIFGGSIVVKTEDVVYFIYEIYTGKNNNIQEIIIYRKLKKTQ